MTEMTGFFDDLGKRLSETANDLGEEGRRYTGDTEKKERYPLS